MKNNLSFYQHKTTSHHHWKFKTLRRKYGWEGEGKFWALNNMIAEADGCMLDIGDEDRASAIAADIDQSPEEFKEYVSFLVKNAKLIEMNNNVLTTGITQENLKEVNTKRSYQREWYKGKPDTTESKSGAKNGKVKVELAPSPYQERYEGFKNWIKEKAPRVGRMKQPMSLDQFERLAKEWDKSPKLKERHLDLLLRMDNYEPLIKKNRSAYRTLLNWADRDEKK